MDMRKAKKESSGFMFDHDKPHKNTYKHLFCSFLGPVFPKNNIYYHDVLIDSLDPVVM
jgi:hypothetical protein